MAGPSSGEMSPVSKSEATKADNPDLQTRDVDSKDKPDLATDRVENPELQSTKKRLDRAEVSLQKSFADAVRGTNVQQRRSNTSPTSFLDPQSPRFGRKETIEGESVAVFSAKELQELEEPLQLSLIGKFSFGRPQLHSIRNYFTAQKIGKLRVHLLNQKHILIELTNSEDYTKIWLRREIHIEGYPMRLFKWTRNFDFQHESSIAPVWVRLENLPLHLYHEAALFTIGQLLGHPLKIDEATRLRSRVNYARLCVEMDLQKTPPEMVKIKQDSELLTVQVVFEKMPKYCTYCKHVGHEEAECYIKGPQPRPKRKLFRKSEELENRKVENVGDTAVRSQAGPRNKPSYSPAHAKVSSGTCMNGADKNLNVRTGIQREVGPSGTSPEVPQSHNRFTVLDEPGGCLSHENIDLRDLDRLEAQCGAADDQDSMFEGGRGLELLPFCEDEPFAEDISPMAYTNSHAIVPFEHASPVGMLSEVDQDLNRGYYSSPEHTPGDNWKNRLACRSPELQNALKTHPISTVQRMTRGQLQRAAEVGTSQQQTRKGANKKPSKTASKPARCRATGAV